MFVSVFWIAGCSVTQLYTWELTCGASAPGTNERVKYVGAAAEHNTNNIDPHNHHNSTTQLSDLSWLRVRATRSYQVFVLSLRFELEPNRIVCNMWIESTGSGRMTPQFLFHCSNHHPWLCIHPRSCQRRTTPPTTFWREWGLCLNRDDDKYGFVISRFNKTNVVLTAVWTEKFSPFCVF